MNIYRSLLWLGVPALSVAMGTWAAGEQMQQHQQTQQTTRENTQQKQMMGEEAPDCAAMRTMDRSKMNMSDPATREMMFKCRKQSKQGKGAMSAEGAGPGQPSPPGGVAEPPGAERQLKGVE